jgi:hypothetical protein
MNRKRKGGMEDGTIERKKERMKKRKKERKKER